MDTAALHLHQAGVDALLVIGGDGSFRGLNAFSARHPFRVAGIPGTIDNDLSGTDFTLGFDTAVNTAVQCMDKILDTAESHDRLFFVEVMGRDAGHIALHAGLAAGAHSILIPEDRGDIERLFEALQNSRRRTPFLVVVSEAEKEDNAFGLAEKVRTRFPELDVRVTVLGHLQRGGSPSYADRLLGTRMGSAAVQALQAGRSGFMCGIQNGVIAEVPLQYCVKSQTPPARDLLQLSAMKWHE
jgi:6-phosphofructokinase 1